MPKKPTSAESPETLADALSALAEAQTSHTALEASLAEAVARATAAEGERDSLRAQFDSATVAATEANTARDTALADLETERTAHAASRAERDSERTRSEAAEANIARLEQLCQIRGIDPKSAVPGANENPADVNTKEEIRKAFAQETDPSKRAAIFRKHEADLVD